MLPGIAMNSQCILLSFCILWLNSCIFIHRRSCCTHLIMTFDNLMIIVVYLIVLPILEYCSIVLLYYCIILQHYVLVFCSYIYYMTNFVMFCWMLYCIVVLYCCSVIVLYCCSVIVLYCCIAVLGLKLLMWRSYVVCASVSNPRHATFSIDWQMMRWVYGLCDITHL